MCAVGSYQAALCRLAVLHSSGNSSITKWCSHLVGRWNLNFDMAKLGVGFGWALQHLGCGGVGWGQASDWVVLSSKLKNLDPFCLS